MYTQIRVHTYAYTCAYACTHIHTYTNMHTHTHVCAPHTHVHRLLCTHSNLQDSHTGQQCVDINTTTQLHTRFENQIASVLRQTQ